MRLALRILVPCLLAAAFVFAGSDKDKAVSLTRKAADAVRTLGRTDAIAKLNHPTGEFTQGELYVFAYDISGIMVANPHQPQLVGRNLLEVAGPDGTFFRKTIVEKARTEGAGWVHYKYENPVSHKLESKATYVLREGALILCCGIYRRE